jgi:hypothetical protein
MRYSDLLPHWLSRAVLRATLRLLSSHSENCYVKGVGTTLSRPTRTFESEYEARALVAHACNPTTQEGEIRRITVQSQPGKIV